MSKREKLVKVFVIAIIGIGFVFGNGYIFSMSNSGSYASPLPNLVDDVFNPEKESILIWGEVFHEENLTPVVNTRVRLFATDELFEDIVYTDTNGVFNSLKKFDPGQLVKIEILDKIFVKNIPIIDIDFYIGVFFV